VEVIVAEDAKDGEIDHVWLSSLVRVRSTLMLGRALYRFDIS
jgi:hypothetical protein